MVYHFRVSKNVRDKRRWWGIYVFPSTLSRLRVPKHFVEQPFCAAFQKTSGSEKFRDKRGGNVKIFRQNFLSHSAENFRRVIFQCFMNFGYRKMLEMIGGRGVINIFRLSCFVAKYRYIS